MSPPLPPPSPYIADPPTIRARPAATGGVGPPPTPSIPGIAATVGRDTDLATHPSVLLYDNMVSIDYIHTHFNNAGVGLNPNNGQPYARPNLDHDFEIIDWPQWGLKAVRCWAFPSPTPDGLTPGNERIIDWHHWAEPKVAGKAWTRDYGSGHEHLFLRYNMCIGEDVAAAFNDLGAKLPGMAGTYDWSTSGAYTDPPPSPYATFEMRLWHSIPKLTDGAMKVLLGAYAYVVQNAPHADGTPGRNASIGQFSGSGNPEHERYQSKDGFLTLGKIHTIEQEVKLNTVKDNTLKLPKPFGNLAQDQVQIDAAINNANPDGELRIWIDGRLVFEQTGIRFRGEDQVRIQDIPFCNIYQGGHGRYPKSPEHYDIGGLCVATEYIGPPKSTAEPEPVAQVATSSLSSLAASMKPGTWAELIAADLDAVVGVGPVGNSEVAIPYANSAPWCPIRKRIVIVGADDGDAPRHIEYDDATNKWSLVERLMGSHNYQHVAVDPFSGDIYQRYAGSLYRYTGAEWKDVTTIPFNIAQVASVALAWWSGPFPGAGPHGVLTVYSGNTGTISAFDPTTGTWLNNLEYMLPGQLGEYHVVSAYSSRNNCLVYGGGNRFQGESPVDRQVWRLNADLSKTRMPDAPHRLGIYAGMNLVGDSASGNVIAFGFGEAWELNPSGAGSWTQMTGSRAPPDGLLSPNVPPNGLISCDVTSFGVVVYIDGLRTRKPKCRMWVYKSARAGVNVAAAAPNYQGQWWNAPAGSEAGWGINFAHQGDVIFATWFTHDANGNAWYMSMTAVETGAGTFAGTLYQTTGPRLDANSFDPNQVQRIEVGNGTLAFSDGNNGTFDYTVNGISQTKPITRQVFGPVPTCTWAGLANPALATNYQDLWWAVGGVESGWGINFAHQGDVIFATWFTYDFNGAALPLSATLTKVGPGVYSGTLLETAGPPFSSVPFDSSAVTRAEVGTATVTFSNGDAATFSYQVSLGGQSASGTRAIERQVFRAPGTVCQ